MKNILWILVPFVCLAQSPYVPTGQVIIPSTITAKTASYTIASTDVGQQITFSCSGGCTATLPQAGTTGFEARKAVTISNVGSGTVTVSTTTSTFIGMGQSGSSMSLSAGQAATLRSTGSNWDVLGYGFGSSGGASSVGVMAYNSSSWTSVAMTWTPMSVDTLEADSSGGTIWTSGNPTRFYATSSGRWTVRAHLDTSGDYGTVVTVRFAKNGATNPLSMYVGNSATYSISALPFEASRTFNLSSGDYIEVYYYMSNSVTMLSGVLETNVTFFKEAF